MGMYSEDVSCDLSLKYVYAVGREFGLPVPREDEHGRGHAMHFRAEDVRKWHERAEEHLRHDMCDPHLFYIARILHTHAIHYLNKVSRETSLSYGLERKNYFRKMTRKYRFYFM